MSHRASVSSDHDDEQRPLMGHAASAFAANHSGMPTADNLFDIAAVPTTTTNAPGRSSRSASSSSADEDAESDGSVSGHASVSLNDDVHRAFVARRAAPPAANRSMMPTAQNLLDFATANTPGPLTGVSGGVGAAASVLNPPTSNVPGSFANSGYVSGLHPASSALANVGLATNVATGFTDLAGIASDVSTAYGMGGARLGAGLRANLPGHVDRNAAEAEDRSAAKRMGVNTLQNAADLGLNQAPTAASTILSATGHTAPAVLGPMAAGAGMGVNALVAGRSAYRGYRAGQHEGNLSDLIKRGQLTDPVVKAAAEHHRDQMNTRKKRSWIGAAGAALGAVGGGLLLGGLLGASMLTPIGWGLAAAGGLVAAGLGAHKLYRWWKKRKEGTLGADRDRHAAALHNAAMNPFHPGHDQAHQVLAARGITPDQVRGPEGVGLLKRKAEAW